MRVNDLGKEGETELPKSRGKMRAAALPISPAEGLPIDGTPEFVPRACGWSSLIRAGCCSSSSRSPAAQQEHEHQGPGMFQRQHHDNEEHEHEEEQHAHQAAARSTAASRCQKPCRVSREIWGPSRPGVGAQVGAVAAAFPSGQARVLAPCRSRAGRRAAWGRRRGGAVPLPAQFSANFQLEVSPAWWPRPAGRGGAEPPRARPRLLEVYGA
eukprot:GHVT01002783.1.p1 GENE.GHVT01002783.1~~GHVT01002783.1.p1  ORF type:complete len:212 (-),score=34.72 GHVT01002783.1:329-964(-)